MGRHQLSKWQSPTKPLVALMGWRVVAWSVRTSHLPKEKVWLEMVQKTLNSARAQAPLTAGGCVGKLALFSVKIAGKGKCGLTRLLECSGRCYSTYRRYGTAS